MPVTLLPIDATASSSSFWRRPVMKTSAPSLTKSFAVARPIPCVAPVMTATFPCSLSIVHFLSAGARTNRTSRACSEGDAADPDCFQGRTMRRSDRRDRDTRHDTSNLILCSEHTIDRSAHLLQNKSRRQAIHHLELIRLTWTNFKSIDLHSFDGDLNHVFHLHDGSSFHVFRTKVTQNFGLCRRRCQVKYLHFGVFQLHTKRLGERMQTGLGGAINR